MARNTSRLVLVPLLLLLSFSFLEANARPASDTSGGEDEGRGLETVWTLENFSRGNELDLRKDEALEKLQEVLGIRSHEERSGRRKVPPQFMIELYNNVADPSGVTRGRNPYNAKVVRSFIERDTSMSQFYFFNISGLEVNESVLEAELHLYRKKTPSESMHPSTFVSPHYLIRVYQVLDDRNLDVPDIHRLLNVRYVGAHGSGWQIFNVKEAVLGWLTGEPNLGLLVTAATLFEDQVSIEFFRRTEYHHSKQPILVLFDDDGKEQRIGKTIVPRYYAYGNDENDDNEDHRLTYNTKSDEKLDLRTGYEGHPKRSKKRLSGREEDTREETTAKKSDYFQKQKRPRETKGGWLSGSSSRDKEQQRRRRAASLAGEWNEDDSPPPTSMEIYERAILREKLAGASETRDREKRSTGNHAEGTEGNTTECSRHELYVDFKEIGLSSSIIAPLGYSAYQCRGVCETPLSQDLQPTNHATIQGIVHKMGLVKGVERPCCVPTKLLGTTILFFDDNENVVLKVYQDMIADRCGCR